MHLQLLGMLKIILLGFCNMGGMKKLWQLWKPVKGGVNSLMRYFQFFFCSIIFSSISFNMKHMIVWMEHVFAHVHVSLLGMPMIVFSICLFSILVYNFF
jgi:hypothetical protein